MSLIFLHIRALVVTSLEQTTNKTVIEKALSLGIAATVTDYMDQVPQNVDGQEVLNNVLADQPALLADNQPVDHNRGNHRALDAVVSARLIFIRFVPIFYRLQAIYQRL